MSLYVELWSICEPYSRKFVTIDCEGLCHDHRDDYMSKYFESRVNCKETEEIGEISNGFVHYGLD